MGPIPNILRAGAGREPCARPLRPMAVATLAIALALASPLAALASLKSDLKALPSDASPKQACAVLIKHNSIKRSQEGECRRLVARGFEAAKAVSSSGTVTIASAAACATKALGNKIKRGQMGKCSEDVAATASKADDNGGGGFDPLGAAGDVAGAIGGAVTGIPGAITGAVSDTILDGFKSIIGLLFGGLQSAITVALIKWITTIPNLSGGHVGSLQASIAVGAGGLLAATMTISIVRFWGSGLTGDGAWAGAEGVARAIVAAILIGLWPQIFSLAVRLSNGLQAGILGEGVQAQLKALFRDLDVIGLSTGVLTKGAVPMFLAIVIAIVGILMLLALVAMKIVITAMTIVLFCAMPLALVLWPIPELAGIARICLRSLAVVLAIPVIWCLIFGSFAAIGADAFSFSNTGKEEGIFGTALNVTIVRPLVAISLLYLAIVMPRRLLQLAPFTGGGPSFGRALATGATLRAGFSYGPQVGKAALSRAQALGAAVGAAGSGRSGGNSGPQAATGKGNQSSTAAQGGGDKGTDKAGQKTPAAALRDQTSQAPKGSQARAQGSLNEVGESPSSAAQSAKARTAARGGGAASASSGSGSARLGGMFNGPETINPSSAHNEEIAQRRKEMAPRSKSGKAVSAGQLDSAIGSLQSQPEFVQAARSAAFHDDLKQATGAFAEWSVSDNPAVSDTHKQAFNVLGQASPGQRKGAFNRLDVGAGGGGGAGGGKGPASPKSGSAGSNDGGRIVPKRESPPDKPATKMRTHPQPGLGGGS